MNATPETTARIAEIDISRHARALGVLRWTDYALVVTCGMYAVGLIIDLLFGPPEAEALVTVFRCAAIAILLFGAYTGWRHVGVIDPTVWRLYLWALPLVSLLVAFMTLVMLLNSQTDGTEESEVGHVLGVVFVMLPIGLLGLAAFVAVLALRRMHIDPFCIRLTALLQRVAVRAGERADSTHKLPRIDARRGSAYALAGGAILLGLILVRVFMTDEMLQRIVHDPLLRAISRTESSIQLLAFFMILYARRYFQVSADALLSVDKRPPILFLRSFSDDEKQSYFNAGSSRGVLDYSLETRLANHFHRFGPFVAIGSPKESIPQLGAARVLLPDDQWQERVLGWMRDAAVIVMYGGKTGWVNWELGQVLNSGSATRLILLIPEVKGWRRSKREQDLRERMQQIRTVFQGSPWQEELAAWTDLSALRAMVFVEDGSAVMIRSRSRSRDSYHLAAMVAHYVLLNHVALPQVARATPDAARSMGNFAAAVPSV